MKRSILALMMMAFSAGAVADVVVKSCDTFNHVRLGGKIVKTENWNLKSLVADSGSQFVVVTQGFDYTSPQLKPADVGSFSGIKGQAVYYTDHKSYGIMHNENSMRTFENCKVVK